MMAVAVTGADPVKRTPFQTNDPFEIPSMMLEPGSYVFKLMEREPQRNVLDVFEVVQLWTGDETRLLSTLLTMPNYDQPTTDKTVFAFFDRGPKQAKALRIWFAPGRNYGQEFVYPKLQAVELAKSVGRAVLSMPVELPGDLGKLAAAPPAPTPVPEAAPAQPITPPPFSTSAAPSPNVAPPAVALAPASTVAKLFPTAAALMQVRSHTVSSEPAPVVSKPASYLPKTASYMALFATLGLVGLASGTLLRLLALRLERR